MSQNESIKTKFTIVTAPSLYLTRNDDISILLFGGDDEWKQKTAAFIHQFWRNADMVVMYAPHDYEPLGEKLAWLFNHIISNMTDYIIVNVDDMEDYELILLGRIIAADNVYVFGSKKTEMMENLLGLFTNTSYTEPSEIINDLIVLNTFDYNLQKDV